MAGIIVGILVIIFGIFCMPVPFIGLPLIVCGVYMIIFRGFNMP